MTDTLVAIPGYRLVEQIYDGSRTRVYRGRRESDQKPVAIKVLKSEYPTFQELVQFRNQYTIAKNLPLAGIVKPITLLNYCNSYALVMEDDGSVSLDREMEKCSDSLAEFFNIAIQIVQILAGLYRYRVIHKDIKPQNILINLQTKQVKLIDFSISSLLPRESQEIQSPNVLEGTLAYMSPEQTGRMNRGIDYRTDFYSLGVTLYELLTGQLPFVSRDPMELVHCHIARIPTPPIELVPAIPQMVSDIVMRLMAKTAELRYQSAIGLQQDLEICRQQWQEKSSISQFTLGRRDISERFVIPETLYGREVEVATLLAAFDRISSRGEGEQSSRSELMLVTGFSGIGKTSVVNEVHKPIVRQRGYFIKGKFDQFKRDIPFSAWVQALQNLMQQLLTENTASLGKWKAKILQALGENGQVIIDVIPELEVLIGKQPPVLELEGSAAQNRFNLLFQKFIRLFATKEHPLVIFLDDLQWADSASLKLMQLLMSETNTGYLLLLGAYRDNEVSAAHPLMLTLDEIRKAEAKVNQITLAPLNQASLNRLIADTLSCPPERAIPLTELVFAKTKGNPFFTNQYLKALHEDGLISFDLSCGYWQCDIAKVKALSVSDDVVEFMAHQLQKLPENTQNILQLAACIGNQFDLTTLAIVCEKSPEETAAGLWKALQEGLVIPISEVYKFFQDAPAVSSRDNNGQLTVPYKFLHDRVQQAAYFLISSEQKQSTHLKIGRLLLRNIPIEEQEEKIFDIVNQLNIGVKLITHTAERDELAQLNLIAGCKARASTAYATAVRYLTVGIELLAASSWENQYELTLALHNEAAEAAYLSTDFEQMERLTQIVLQQAKSLLDKVKVYEVKIQTYIAQNKPLSAINTALSVIKLLGISFPQQPSQSDIQLNLEEVKLNLTGKRIKDLIDLPLMTDPLKQAAMHIISSIISPAYIAVPELIPLLTFKIVNLSVKHGNTPISAIGYVTYGLILCSAAEIEDGYQFGKLALDLVERVNAESLKCRVLFLFNDLIKHWKDSVSSTLEPLRSAYYSGLETGDIEYAAWSIYIHSAHLYLSGKELETVEREMTVASEVISQFKQDTSLNYHQMFHQSVLNLMGRSENPYQLIGQAYDRLKMLPVHEQSNDKNALFVLYLQQLILCYVFGEYATSVENAARGEKELASVPGLLIVPIFHFYNSLSRLAVYPDATTSEQTDILLKVATSQEKMQKWAHHAPMNHLHKFYLVQAEQYRVLGSYLEAMDSYDKAIAGAKENEYINEEALAHELAAKFYLTWGKETIAQAYMTNAYYCYARWGAKAKVEDLEKRYPQLLALILSGEKSLHTGETITPIAQATLTSSVTGSSAVLDLATVIKASQALSGEIHFDKLLSTLMTVAIENAGASKCALILSEADRLVIEATGVIPGGYTPESKTEATVLQSIPVEESQEIPVTIINYVYRTQKTLVVDDVSTENAFAADPYIAKQQPKSVLCTPVINQGKLTGILYLENHLIEGAFTRDRLEVLKVISSQAAISIENAKLYSQIAESERRLAQFLEAVPVGVFVADAIGTPYYANQTAQQILGKGIVTNAASEQLAEVYQAYLAGGKQLYPQERDALLRALKGESSTLDDMEIHQSGKIIPVEVWGTPIFDEQGQVAYAIVAFTDITQRKQAEKLIAEYNHTLELQVAERTQELKSTLDYLKDTQEELIQSEKMAALGHLIAGIAHEINTPLGAIRSSISNIAEFFSENLEKLPAFFQNLSSEHQQYFSILLTKSNQASTSLSSKEKRQIKKDLKRQLEQEGIDNADTLASTLVNIGVYDEIQPFLPLLKDSDSEKVLKAAYDLASVQRSTRTITIATERAAKVVFALKTYGRYDHFGEKVQANVAEGIDTVLTLYQNQLKHGVELIRNYDQVPAIWCYPDELNQVWTNLVHNALQAMDYKGILRINVTRQEPNVLVSITDSGKGIPPEIMPKIFEPFFTTKASGEGSGLGLDIVKKILDKHQGKIEVSSVPGQTTFTLFLPINKNDLRGE